METTTEKLDVFDLTKLRSQLSDTKHNLSKAALYIYSILAVFLFVPLEILRWVTRSGRRASHLSGTFFNQIGAFNTIVFIIIPITLILIYLYIRWTSKYKKDLKEETKEVTFIKIKEIKPMSKQEFEDFEGFDGLLSHIAVFEPNSFKIPSEYFSERRQPEMMLAKGMRIERAMHSKLELKRDYVLE